jgi:diketogulonate reductase-like aldo/keto reductase
MKAIAEKKGITSAQLALAWIGALGELRGVHRHNKMGLTPYFCFCVSRISCHYHSRIVVRSLMLMSRSTGLMPPCRKKSRTLENLAAANVTLTTAEFEAVNKAIAEHGVKGHRYML